jgi:methylmalonyl-CoA mutase
MRMRSITQTPGGHVSDDKISDKVRELDAEWLNLAKKELKSGITVNDLIWNTVDGLIVKPIYTKKDVESVDDELPGKFPYTRGPYATMYTTRPWTIRQVDI